MTARHLGVERALVDGRWVAGDVAVDGDGRLADIGLPVARGRGSAVPGFVDVQVNGFGGVSFSERDVDLRPAAEALARTGVTTFLVTIPTTHPDRYPALLAQAARWIDQGSPGARPLGVHLEGPFLARPGAHNPDWFQPPEPARADQLLAAAPVALMTLAAEVPGARALIRHLVDRGVVVSVGHTDADAGEAHAAFDAGATAVTHLWNAQTPMESRAPGVVGAALARPDIWCCMIADLVHVAADTLTVSLAASGERAVVVTDAVSVAGLDPGDAAVPTTGGARLRADGSFRLPDGTLAGSAATLDESVRTLVRLGRSVEQAVHAVTAAPAALLRRPDIGALRIGGIADVVVLDDELRVTRTLVAGAET